MIQPMEFIGTSKYKIGCSKDKSLNRCQNGYRKGTRYIVIMECNDPFVLERKIKEVFNKKFTLFKGNEYFEGDENAMKMEFLKITHGYDITKFNVKEEQKINKIVINEDKNKPAHVNEINFYCKYCDFFGKSLFLIKQHINTKKHINMSDNDILLENYNKKFYKCSECGKVCNDRSNLKKHIKNTHNSHDVEVSESTAHSVGIPLETSVVISNDPTSDVIKFALTLNDHDIKMGLIKLCIDQMNKTKN
jgi:hypothetical protein